MQQLLALFRVTAMKTFVRSQERSRQEVLLLTFHLSVCMCDITVASRYSTNYVWRLYMQKVTVWENKLGHFRNECGHVT